MINFIKRMCIKYKELLLYGIFGCITTVINIYSFKICYDVIKMPLLVSNTLAWIFAFIFAFVTNKIWVFESRDWKSEKAIKEMTGFLLARLATLLLDSVIMWLFVDVLLVNSLLSKIVSNIITIAINYLASKFIIFKNEK